MYGKHKKWERNVKNFERKMKRFLDERHPQTLGNIFDIPSTITEVDQI